MTKKEIDIILKSTDLKEVSEWVSDNIICHFDYWDRPLSGLCYYENKDEIKIGNEYIHFKVIEEHIAYDEYEFFKFTLNAKQQEFLLDYQNIYPHCFHGERYNPYAAGGDLDWFTNKWEGKIKWN